MSPAPAALLLAGLAAAGLLADRIVSVAAITRVLLLVCLRAPAGRRRLYLVGALGSGLAVFVLTPFVSNIGFHVIWSGPTGIRMAGSSPGSPIRMSFAGDPRVLLRPRPLRFRYGDGG